jgi:tetratricopeptide (TPR) repeat protein
MAEISLQEYCEQIESTIEQGRYAEAVAHGKCILKHYSKHVATYRMLGKAMLEAGQDEYAIDMFRRVLSADPEDMLAWVGMSEVHSRRGELDAAVWYLERAFELATDNKVVEEELRHLYGRRDGIEAQRVQLTRGALARLYLRGDLLSRAIGEFRALLAEHPERVDLSIALAEALWRNDQRLEASEVCQQVLDVLPYCLKVNLILGEIWNSSGREEGQMYLRRAEALDPENRVAQELFGAASVLPAREVRIVPLEYQPPVEEERPTWMAEVEAASLEGPPLTEREAALVDVAAALEAQIEIPPWLEEISLGEEAPATVPPTMVPTEPLEEQLSEEAVPAPEEEMPEWMAGIREESVEERPEAIVEEETPEWLTGLGMEPISEEDVPERPSELVVEPTGVEETPVVPEEKEAPDWLAGLGAGPAAEEAAPSVSPAEEPPDWLAGFREQLVEEIGVPEEAPAPVVQEVSQPAWLEGEGLPSGDEALEWLERLAEGKEEELRAQVEAEAEVRMAEIMGRPKPAERPPEEVALEEAIAPPVEETIVPPTEETFGWTAFGESGPSPVVEEAPVVEPAFGWTAFGEPEAPPEAIPTVEAVEEIPPMEEIAPSEALARVLPEEVEAPPMEEVPVVEERLPPEEVLVPEVAPPTEEVRWGAALEAPLEEAEVAPALVIEEVPGMPEMEITEPLEEAAAVSEAPIFEAPVEPFAAERAHLKGHPRDYEAWLALARALWQAGEQEEALRAYTRVIRAGKFLESVVPDLEGYMEQEPDVSTQRVLGDAYMRDGRLQDALDIYRRALETL